MILKASWKKIPLDKFHALGYIICGGVSVLGLIATAMVFLSDHIIYEGIGVLMIFAIIVIPSFMYLICSQETRSLFSMSHKRSLLYALSCFLLTVAVSISLIILSFDITVSDIMLKGFVKTVLANINIEFLGSLILILPGLGLFVYMMFTQKTRIKPWTQKLIEKYETIYDEKFGLLSGAIWIGAFGLFVLFGFLIGWHVSWVVFIFATVGQLLLQYSILKNSK
jgi:hypothetical protein